MSLDNQTATAERVDVDSIINSVVEHKAPTPSASLTHYGMSMLIDLPLLLYIGHQQFVPTEYIKGLDYWPKFRLVPFKNITVGIPPMRLAKRTTTGTVSDLAAPFDPDAAEGLLEGGGAINQLTKSALQCANFASELFRESGFGLFPSLVGYEPATANELIDVFLPLRAGELLASPDRLVLGETFRAPFLDEVLDFLINRSPRLIADAGVDSAQQDQLGNIYRDVLNVAQNAWDASNTILDETDEDLQAKPSQKRAYDRRDRRFSNAPEPRDLVCLAHTGRTPIDERALVNAQKLQETANQPMTDAVKALTKAAEALGGGVKVTAPGVSEADIEAEVEKRVQERMAAGGASTTEETGGAQTEARKCKGVKKDQTACQGYAVPGGEYCAAHLSQAQ